MTFFHSPRHRPDAAAARAATALANAAAVGLLHQRVLHQQRMTIAQLQHALSSRVAIEQAKGVIAERRGISTAEGFNVLRRRARARSQPLHQLARNVVDGTDDLAP